MLIHLIHTKAIHYFWPHFIEGGASLVVQIVKNPPANAGDWVQPLGREDHLEKGMATHSFQYSCLEKYRGAWWAAVHEVTMSWA